MGDYSAFFYGTLMATQVLYRVCFGTPNPTRFQKNLLTIRPAILHSYCRRKVEGCDYPAVIPSPGSSVRGTYVQGLTEGDLGRLDIFEGDQYIRQNVRVRLLNVVGDESGKGNVEGQEAEASLYVWVDANDGLEDGEWDFAEFMRDKISKWIGSSDEYEEVDQAVRAEGGDPTGGRGTNGKITEQLETNKKVEEALGSAV
ncbi:MAG: hypothetical protein Q9191_001137 [Dirinaria sp. TL-2023a]